MIHSERLHPSEQKKTLDYSESNDYGVGLHSRMSLEGYEGEPGAQNVAEEDAAQLARRFRMRLILLLFMIVLIVLAVYFYWIFKELDKIQQPSILISR